MFSGWDANSQAAKAREQLRVSAVAKAASLFLSYQGVRQGGGGRPQSLFFLETGGRGLGSLDFEIRKNRANFKKYGPAGVLLFFSLKS